MLDGIWSVEIYIHMFVKFYVKFLAPRNRAYTNSRPRNRCLCNFVRTYRSFDLRTSVLGTMTYVHTFVGTMAYVHTFVGHMTHESGVLNYGELRTVD